MDMEASDGGRVKVLLPPVRYVLLVLVLVLVFGLLVFGFADAASVSVYMSPLASTGA
jgi:hypothetical protein